MFFILPDTFSIYSSNEVLVVLPLCLCNAVGCCQQCVVSFQFSLSNISIHYCFSSCDIYLFWAGYVCKYEPFTCFVFSSFYGIAKTQSARHPPHQSPENCLIRDVFHAAIHCKRKKVMLTMIPALFTNTLLILVISTPLLSFTYTNT